MKRLVLVRHAKAVSYGYEDDFNRKLASHGETDALKVSNYAKSKGLMAELIITSPATRALQTATIFARNYNYPLHKIVQVEEIYDGFNLPDFMEYINSLPQTANTVFMFGHNPDLHNYVSSLVQLFNYDLPTCAMAGIDFNVETWAQVRPGAGDLSFYVTPKLL